MLFKSFLRIVGNVNRKPLIPLENQGDFKVLLMKRKFKK